MNRSPRPLATSSLFLALAILVGVVPAQDPPRSPPPRSSLGVPSREPARGSVPTSAASPDASKSPRWTALVPAIETGATRFRQAHPEYDGRGIVVAIFDDGVDPGAPGLQTTPDGRPKLLDVIDGTGAGDVDTTAEREAEEGKLTGLTGRTLTLGDSQRAPGRKYRVGWKAAYDFFPRELVGRLKREHREKLLEENVAVESMLRASIEAFKKERPERTGDDAKTLADREARLEQLAKAIEKTEDFGPVFDVVAYHDGRSWRAIVDADADGDLAEEKSLCDFSCEREYATFGFGSSLNVAVRVDPDGSRVTLVTPAGAHATHVAGIVGAYDANRPENCGVAPGVQIVSVRIGDPRLDAMETGRALVRAAAAAARWKVDLVNMSYGEPTSRPDRGALTRILTDLVERRGIVYVASAGNEGPALSTVGAPGGTTGPILGIGAYVSPQMAREQYSRVAELGGLPFTWSSRGPTLDGDLGVDLLAPGGAFAPVPNFTRQGRAHMNGTSMSSPNACGAIALLLSGLRAEKVAWTPDSIARALAATARPVDGVERFAQGAGMIQVDAAFDHATRFVAAPGEPWSFDVETSQGRGARGISLREPHEVAGPQTFNVRVTPRSSKYWEEREREAATRKKIDFDLRLDLECTAEWVTTARSLVLPYEDRAFAVTVDPNRAPPGASFAEVLARDADAPDRGPIFRVPISVFRPTAPATVGASIDLLADPARDAAAPGQTAPATGAEMKPGDLRRCFLHVPLGATWATIRLTQRSEGPRPISATVVQAPVDLVVREPLALHDATLPPHEERLLHTPVTGGRTLEVCLAHEWNGSGPCRLAAAIEFHGLAPDSSRIAFSPGEAATRVEVRALAGDAPRPLDPRGSLDALRRVIAPASSTLEKLEGQGAGLPSETPLFELKLVYEFERDEPGEVTARLPAAEELLYESPFANVTWDLFQGDRRVASDDVYPDEHRVERGPHRLVATLWSADRRTLERRRKSPLWLEESIDEIGLRAFASRAEAVADGETFGRRTLQPGAAVGVHFAAPSPGSWPDDARAGDVLLGSATFGVADDETRGLGDRPDGWPIEFVVPRVSDEDDAADDDAGEEDFSLPKAIDAKSLADASRVARIKVLAAIPQSEPKLFDEAAAALSKEYPDARDVRLAKLKWLDHEDHREERLDAIEAACDAVLETLDEEKIATALGRRRPDDGAAATDYDERKKEREILVDALYRKGRALGYRELPEVVAKTPVKDPAALDAAFEANFARLARWVDPGDQKYSLLLVRRERRKERFGLALAALEARRDEVAIDYWRVKKRRDLYESLGWGHLLPYAESELLQRFPRGEE